MRSKKVKAIDLLKHPTPVIVKGKHGVCEIVKVETDSSRIKLYRLTPNGHHSLVIARPHDEYLEVFTNTDADHLLDTIGTLHKRNKSLTKGHATLTRRVQELEAALEAEKKRTFATWSEKGLTAYDNKVNKVVQIGAITSETSAVSKAQHDLQQFITEEVKRQLVAATKLGGILNGR